MKIADVSGFYSETGGGVASYVRQKLKWAEAWGHEVVVIAPGAESRVEPRPGGRIIWVKAPQMPFDANYHVFVDGREVWQALDREQPDVVEGSSPWRGGWLAGLWRGNAVKSLFFHQDFVAGYPYTLLDRRMSHAAIDRLFAGYWRYVKRLSDHFDVTVTGGEWLARRLDGFGVKSPLAIPLGIDPGVFSADLRDENLRRDLLARCGVGPHGKLLLAVGRLHPEKRHAAMLEGFSLARQSRPDLGLLVIGDGPIKGLVEKQVARTPGAILMGPIKDRQALARAYASGDLLVHGSGAETYGLVVAEAIASGLPVVAPDIGGAADLARSGVHQLYAVGRGEACGAAILSLLAALDGPNPPTPGDGPQAGFAEAHFAALFALYERLVAARAVTSLA